MMMMIMMIVAEAMMVVVKALMKAWGSDNDEVETILMMIR